MKGKRIGRLAIGILLVSVALAWLVFAGTRRNLVYYYEVDELLAASENLDGEIRISGDVVAGTVEHDAASRGLRFAITRVEAPTGSEVTRDVAGPLRLRPVWPAGQDLEDGIVSALSAAARTSLSRS